jgi:methionyl-tRNA formyltransferase
MSTVEPYLTASVAAPGAPTSHRQTPKVLFWGTTGLFSSHVLRDLGRNVRPQAMMVPGAQDQRQAVQLLPAPLRRSDDENLLLSPQFMTPTPITVGWQWDVPVYALSSVRSIALQTLLQDLAPDVVCVACFPWRIPAALLTIPTHGFVNLHPSLLPAYRGPAPLFWQLRAGARQSGVTLHRMNAKFDQGAILAQQPLTLPIGANSAELDQRHAALAATLLTDYLQRLATGEATAGAPQTGEGSYHSWPQTHDFTLDRRWSAAHAYSFMRGTDEWRQPYLVFDDGKVYQLRHAIAFAPTQTLSLPIERTAQGIAVQFTPGVLYATLA